MTTQTLAAPVDQAAFTERSLLLEKFLNPMPEFRLNASHTEEATPVRDCVRERYQAAYHAEVRHFLPWLLSMQCLGQVSGVAGLQPAGSAPLYLEQYLSAPVETLLGNRSGSAVARSKIVEVGNLVAARKGASHLLFLMFTQVLHAAGYEWMVFTATHALRNNLTKLGFELQEVQAIDTTALSPRLLDEWGSYYSTEPVVMAGRLSSAANLVQSRTLYRRIARLYRPFIRQLAATLQQGEQHAA